MSHFASYPSLRQRNIVITGGASGIGKALVTAFAEQGSQVIFLDIQDDLASELIQQLSSANRPPLYHHCDLTSTAAIQRTVSAIRQNFPIIDVLINNAGNDTRHSTASVTSEDWDRLIALNLKHQFFMTQAVIPAMQVAAHGSIINLSSISWAIPSTGLPVYIAAKAGIVGLTRTLAHELGPRNIRVNCIMPGAIATERQQQLWYTEEYKAEILRNQALKRILVPEDVARLALFLAADDSSAITNQSYVIDGGWI